MMSGAIDMQDCRGCGRRWKVGFPGCPYCGSASVQTISVAAEGAVYSWVEVHRSLEDPPADVPYTVVTVDVDGGGRVFGRWAGADEPYDGQRVRSQDGEVHGAAALFSPDPR
jgi:uncharacterized OB-fold protein